MYTHGAKEELRLAQTPGIQTDSCLSLPQRPRGYDERLEILRRRYTSSPCPVPERPSRGAAGPRPNSRHRHEFPGPGTCTPSAILSPSSKPPQPSHWWASFEFMITLESPLEHHAGPILDEALCAFFPEDRDRGHARPWRATGARLGSPKPATDEKQLSLRRA